MAELESYTCGKKFRTPEEHVEHTATEDHAKNTQDLLHHALVLILIVVLVEQFLLDEGIAEGVVVLVAHFGEVVRFAVWGFPDLKLVDYLLELRRDHKLDMVAFKLL